MRLQYCMVDMNKADSDRIHELCSLIDKEQDREKFLILVHELSQILNKKEARLQSKGPGIRDRNKKSGGRTN